MHARGLALHRIVKTFLDATCLCVLTNISFLLVWNGFFEEIGEREPLFVIALTFVEFLQHGFILGKHPHGNVLEDGALLRRVRLHQSPVDGPKLIKLV